MGYPKPNKTAICRIFGPYINRHGMNVYSVYDVRTMEKICPDLMSFEEATQRADDYIHGRVRMWFKGIPFKRVPAISEEARRTVDESIIYK